MYESYGLTNQLQGIGLNANNTTLYPSMGMRSPTQSMISANGNTPSGSSAFSNIGAGMQNFSKGMDSSSSPQSQWWGSQYQDVARDNQTNSNLMMTAMLQKMFTNPAIIQLLQSKMQGASSGS